MAKTARSLWTAKLLGGGRPVASAKGKVQNKAASEHRIVAIRGVRAVILGIDPSLRGTGLAVIDTRNEPPRLLASHTVKLPPKLAAYECMGRIAEEAEKLAQKYAVTHAAIEETIYVQNFRTALLEEFCGGTW